MFFYHVSEISAPDFARNKFSLKNKRQCDKFIVPMSFYESLVNSLDEVIVVIDLKNEIIFINKAGEELLGVYSESVKGEKLSSIFEDDRVIAPLVKKSVREMRRISGNDVPLTIKENLRFDFTIAPLIEREKASGAVISLRRSSEFSKKADDLFDSIIYLLSSVAHEIKNPLSGIRGGAQLLKKKRFKGTAKYLDIIIKETERLDDIVKSYLFVGRKPVFNRINIHKVIEAALSVLDAEFKRGDITLKKGYDPSLPPVKGDEGKLLQVFINIIKNAQEAMPSGGTLEIKTRPAFEYLIEKKKKVKRRFLVITFSDTGTGITQEDQEKIFIPFFTRKRDGSGLGLSISKKIIRDHDGLIKVKTVPGKGTAVDIYLPFAGP